MASNIIGTVQCTIYNITLCNYFVFVTIMVIGIYVGGILEHQEI